MPNTAEDDALTAALIAQIMAEDLGETLEQHNRPIGSSVEDYEDPLSSFERGEVESTRGEDGTGWGDEEGEESASGPDSDLPTSDESSDQPAPKYPGGWDSHTAYSDGLKPAGMDNQDHAEQENDQLKGPASHITHTRHASDPLPAYTGTAPNVVDAFTMSLPNTPADYGPGNVWYDTSSPDDFSKTDVLPLDTSTNPARRPFEQDLINVWGPEDIDTSPAKNKGKARAPDEEEREVEEDQDSEDDDGEEGDDDEEEAADDQRTLKAKRKARAPSTRDPSINPCSPTSLLTSLSSKRFARYLQGQSLLTNICTCDSCASYPSYQDEEGNEIPLIHIPWPGSETDEIADRAEDNEVVEIRVGEEETLDSILMDIYLRDGRRERGEREVRGMVAC